MVTRQIFRNRRRTYWLLGIAFASGILALVFGDAIQRAVYFRLSLAAPTIDRAEMTEFIQSREKPFRWLQRLWHSEKIPHRRAVMHYLQNHVRDNEGLSKKSQALLVKAAKDVDMDVRRAALSVMVEEGHPDRIRAIRYQLQDLDPAARRLGIQLLRRLDEPKWLPLVAERLTDSDLEVRVAAASLMRQWTEKDFGVRHRLVSGAPNRDGGSDQSEDLKKVEQGIQQWQAWWQGNRSKHRSIRSMPAPLDGPMATFSVSDFRLETLNGETVRLSDFHGRPVILNFWTTWCPSCQIEIPKLIRLKRRLGEEIAILGISLDASPEGHTHSDEALSSEEKAALKQKVRETVRQKGINYTVLHDPHSRVGQRFNGHELPTNVLIGPQGKLHRRFVGERSVAAFAAMIEQVKLK